MNIKKDGYLVGWVTGVLFVVLLSCGILLAPDAEASLPSRATPTPTLSSRSGRDKEDERPIGAWIELHTQSVPAGAWAVVQWQDSAGNWHDVEGWRGELAKSSRWWVAHKDFGTGAFRWVIMQGQDGPLVGASPAFNLPGSANETLQVTLSLTK
jgi:hypothetical protein